MQHQITHKKYNDIDQLEEDKVQRLRNFQRAQKFLAQLAKKCTQFMDTTSRKQSQKYLMEQIWKNQALLSATRNHQQLQRLVERDWKFMGEQERAKMMKSSENFETKLLEQELRQLQDSIKSNDRGF